jgi:hypothetical protein
MLLTYIIATSDASKSKKKKKKKGDTKIKYFY